MNIAFVHSHKFRFDGQYFYSPGGLSNSVLSKYLTSANDLLTVFARVVKKNKNENNLSRICDKRIRIIDSRTVKLRSVLQKFDKVILRMPSSACFRAFINNKPLYKKTMIEVVGPCFESLWFHSIKGKFAAPFYEIIMKKCVKDANYVSYVTNVYLQKKYKNCKHTLGCTDAEILVDNNALNERFKKKNKNLKRLIFCTIGSLDVNYKNQLLAVKAIDKINKKRGYSWSLILIGPGKNKAIDDYIKKRKLTNIQFTGSVQKKELFDYLNSADVYIHPSKVEGMPRSLLEAMSLAMPIVASNAGEIPLLISKECIFNPRSLKSIVKVLENIDHNFINLQSKNNYDKSKLYDKCYTQKMWQQFYRKFLSSV